MHRYEGRPAQPIPAQDGDRGDRLEIRSGYGIVGDRYAGRPAHRDANVTVLAVEGLEALAAELGAPPFDALLARRNVVLRGVDVEALRGRRPGPLQGPAPSLRGVGGRGSFIPAAGWTWSPPRARTGGCGGEAASAARRCPTER